MSPRCISGAERKGKEKKEQKIIEKVKKNISKGREGKLGK